MSADRAAPDKLSVVVFSATFERIHYALAMAAAAAASNTAATLFFTMGASRALLAGDGEPGWKSLPSEMRDQTAAEADAAMRQRQVAGFEDLLEACVGLEVRMIVCEMGLRALGLENAPMLDMLTVDRAGIVTFLADASKDGGMLFI